MKRSYALATDAPPAWSWDQYDDWLSNAWAARLEQTDPHNEVAFHRFLEAHPSLLPGGDAGRTGVVGGHHGAWNDLVVSQPVIPGLSKRIPDFMWLTKTSQAIMPVLIELEAPGKRWFRADGLPTAQLAQAHDQVAQWKTALADPARRLQMADLYDFPASWMRSLRLAPRLVLIYGRRSEFDGRPDLNQKRGSAFDPDIESMTFDRLRPLAGCRNSVCARSSGLVLDVVAIPPTFRIGPHNAEALAFMGGWEKAISVNELITTQRRSFLLGRLSYWRERGRLSRIGSLGPVGPLDWE